MKSLTMFRYSFLSADGSVGFAKGIAVVREHAHSDQFYLHDYRPVEVRRASCPPCQQHFLRPVAKDQEGHRDLHREMTRAHPRNNREVI